jgi:hypothetical protein
MISRLVVTGQFPMIFGNRVFASAAAPLLSCRACSLGARNTACLNACSVYE